MSEGTYTVWVWFPDDSHTPEMTTTDLGEAVAKSASLAQNVGARSGTTRRICIVDDSDDSTILEWQYGKGLVFPTQEDLYPNGQ